MEWQLPIQKVEIGNIHIGSPWSREQRRDLATKPMAPLSYFGTQFRLPFVTLLFPPLPIVEYNPVTGKLILDMSETNLACIKLSTFQETLVNAIVYHQHGWFKSEFKKEDVKGGFQPILENTYIHLHVGSQGRANNVPLYRDGKWSSSFSTEDLKMGTRVRVAVKIHGVSFLMNGETWSGRCRLQHRIQGILVQQQQTS
jgi:hypothetical protein